MPLPKKKELEFLQGVLQNAGALLVVLDAQGRIRCFNRACEHLSGYNQNEVEGKFPWDFLIPAEDADTVRQHKFEALRNNTQTPSNHITHHWVSKQGEHFLIEWSNTSLFDTDGKFEGMISVGTDITARKATDDALRASNQVIAAVLDTTPVLIAYLDPAFNFVRVNTAYAVADNQEPTYFVGKNHFDLFPNAENEAIFRRVLESGETHFAAAKPFEYAHNPERGLTHWDWTLTPVKDNDEKITGLVLSLSNVSDRIEALETAERSELGLIALTESLEARILERTRDLTLAKESAERANFAKSQFLSRMSHELRTPMNAILGFTQVLEQDTTSPEHKDYLNEINLAGNHLLKLINELLDLSRIETGHLAVQMQPVPLNAALSRALHITQPLMATRNISLLNHGAGDFQVHADSTRLSQILINLLSNATKYNRPGGRITIAIQSQGEHSVRIAITDTGSGIAPDKLSRLFRPFERLGAEHTEVDGVGIGLALSKQLAELMGAKIGVESHPGQGSTFWLDLTLADASQVLSTTPDKPAIPSVEAPQRQRKILYVEDNPSNLKLVEVIFRRQLDITLLSATNGEDGLELARRYHPDAILLDIHLPKMNGYEVLVALKADTGTSNIPVLALSADAMAIDVERGLKAGFLRYLTKPVDASALIANIRDVTWH